MSREGDLPELADDSRDELDHGLDCDVADSVRPFLFSDFDPHETPVVDLTTGPETSVLSSDSRDYLLTGGRADGGRAGVQVDTVVSAAGLADDADRVAGLGAEARAIIVAVRLDARPVADIARQVSLSLGVTRVIVGDLVDDGFLVRAAAPQNEVTLSLLEQLMAGIEAL